MLRSLFIITAATLLLSAHTCMCAEKVVVIPLSTSSQKISSSDFYRNSISRDITSSDNYIELYADCNPGDVPISGGYLISGIVANYPRLHIHASIPSANGTSWYVGSTNNGGSHITLKVYVKCMILGD